jgi:hypothetical protein
MSSRHVAAAWLGHSTLVANNRYWQVTESDFAQALSGVEAAQHAHAEGRQ